MSKIINLLEYKKTKHYPVILPESERKELIECGYNPDDPDDVQEYWNDILEI